MTQNHQSHRLRRTTAALVGVLALAGLAGCGQSHATMNIYTPAAGPNDRSAAVDVLTAVIVSTEDGSGTVIATLVNNADTEPARLTSVSGESPEVGRASSQSVRIPADGMVNLAEHDTSSDVPRIQVAGDFEQGDFVTLSFAFGDGTEVTLDVPVVPNDGEYAGLDGPASEEHDPVLDEHLTEHGGGGH